MSAGVRTIPPVRTPLTPGDSARYGARLLPLPSARTGQALVTIRAKLRILQYAGCLIAYPIYARDAYLTWIHGNLSDPLDEACTRYDVPHEEEAAQEQEWLAYLATRVAFPG